jgi:hypothetical protein
MERIEDHIEDALIDLGAVSVETKGLPGDYTEVIGENDRPLGLADD